MKKLLAIAIVSIFATFGTRAVILFRTADPDANTTAPTNDFAGSGWNYEGQFGPFLGTPIAPHFFLTAKHIGPAGSVFTFQGINYTIINRFDDLSTDLTIWQVAETFPFFAPLYTKLNEVGQRLVVIGRGTQRGGGILVEGNLRGWGWGGSDNDPVPGQNLARWGENVVFGIAQFSPAFEALYATFDQNGLADESHLSSGDSGGAVFLDDGGIWKLAGINYSVDGSFYTDSAGGGGFVAALFDINDFWVQNEMPPPNYVQIMSETAAPSGFYSTRISNRLPWICSAIADSEVGREGNFVTLTYTKLLFSGNEVTYAVQKSSDLVTWSTVVNPPEEIVSTMGDSQRIKAKVDIGTATTLFLRLSTTRP